MSENEKNTQGNDNSIYYILGGVVLVAAVAGFFLLKPKAPVTPAAVTAQPAAQGQPAVQPTLAPITKLACEKQYYNPKVGFPEYYLSVEGVDTATAGTITCDYEISVKDKVVKNATVTGELVADTIRGGGTFRCITEPLELSKGIATKVDVTLTNAGQQTAECSQTFLLP